MYKLVLLIFAMLAVAAAKPAVVAAPLAYTSVPVAAPVAAPVAYTAPGLVTATSSQYVARNYNGVFAAPYIAAAAAAPLVAPSAPLITSSAYSYAPAFVF